MNATLQCFCHIEKFVNFFKYNPQIDKIKNGNNLSSSFKILIENLWPKKYEKIFKNDKINKNEYYAPEEFKKKISKMNSLFEGIAANDSKDLVNFIIMTLHKELHKPNKNIENNNNIFIDQSNQQMVFNNFAKDFMSKNQSIISDLFYGINCNITECLNCHNKLYNYQTYFFLIFSLEEVRKFNVQKYFNNNQFNFNNNFIIYNNMNNNRSIVSDLFYGINCNITQCGGCNTKTFNFQTYFFIVFPLEEVRKYKLNYQFNNFNNINNNVVTIFDCFNYDKKINVMSGDNSMYCNYCKRNCPSSMCTVLTTCPEVLILLLNRGKGKEFDVKILFNENLDLNQYVQYNNAGTFYHLIGVISHIGDSSMSGHFIAYCKDPILNKWHKYNDAIVTDVNNFEQEVVNFAMPYLLFYQKGK
jgi:ubiquitin C-terminal hydrolase